jgi:hypothetical protein
MKTVCDLISPVVLFVNSAVTNSGAAYVMSLSLHSSTEYLVGSNRWSRKLSDIEPEKSSIGEISSKISSRPEWSTGRRDRRRRLLDARLPGVVADEPVERRGLQVQEVRDLQGLADLRERDTGRASRGAGTAKGRSFRRQQRRLPQRSDWRRHTRPTGRTYGPRGYMTGGSATRQHSRRPPLSNPGRGTRHGGGGWTLLRGAQGGDPGPCVKHLRVRATRSAAAARAATQCRRRVRESARAPDRAGRRRGGTRCGRARECGRPAPAGAAGYYLTVTVAPAASRAALAFSAASLATFSRTGLGAPSTRSLASLRPRLVRLRTSLMTWIFLSPAASRTTSNSSCSAAASAVSPPPPPRRRPRRRPGRRR